MKTSHAAWLLVVSSVIGLAPTPRAAEPPERINYQGVLRDSAGHPLDGTYDMVFRLYDAPGDAVCVGGTLLLTDAHESAGTGAVTVTDGLFDVAIGDGLLIPGTETSLSNVFRAHDDVYLEVSVESETLCPRIRFAVSGFALNADTVDGIDSSALLRSDTSDSFESGILNVASGSTLDVDGTLRMDAEVTKATTDVVLNLNADLLDDRDSSEFAEAGHAHPPTSGYLAAPPLEGCHLVTNGIIKTPGVYCPDGFGGEVLCVSNANESPVNCSQLSDPNCRAFCLDTSTQTSGTSTLARPILQPGVVRTWVDRLLACHLKGTTLVTLEQRLVCDSGSCTPGDTTRLATNSTSFQGLTNPSPMWRTLPGTLMAGIADIADAGDYSVDVVVTMETGAPYGNASCFLVNRIDDDPGAGTDDNNRIAIVSEPFVGLSSW